VSGWQTYSDPQAIARLADGKCPECGAAVEAHGGAGGSRCTLTDTGVAGRVHQYLVDLELAPGEESWTWGQL
jgi:tRNA(Ile2) C34 agmatinyltransferase TiaS